MMKDRSLYIRCDETTLRCLNRLAEVFQCSQSDVVEECVKAFNDYQLMNKEDKMYIHISKHLKKGRAK